jgi:hypothetical protein
MSELPEKGRNKVVPTNTYFRVVFPTKKKKKKKEKGGQNKTQNQIVLLNPGFKSQTQVKSGIYL